MEKLLTKEQYEELYNSISEEVNKLDEKLSSISINDVLMVMGFPANNE